MICMTAAGNINPETPTAPVSGKHLPVWVCDKKLWQLLGVNRILFFSSAGWTYLTER